LEVLFDAPLRERIKHVTLATLVLSSNLAIEIHVGRDDFGLGCALTPNTP